MAFDEPEEHWAPPDSLDPTPVWKQYIVVVLLGVAVVAFGAVTRTSRSCPTSSRRRPCCRDA